MNNQSPQSCETKDKTVEDEWVMCPACSTEFTLDQFKRMKLEAIKEVQSLREKIAVAERYFNLILVQPIDEPKSAYEFQSLWERDKRDARCALMEFQEK